MYDELIKKIRHCATDPMHCLSCVEDKDGRCFARLMTQAADAIERLEAALILMVLQYCTDEDGTLWHQFMCAGEGAFDALGITLKTNPQVLWDRLEKLEAKEKS